MSYLSERRRHGRLSWMVSIALLLGGGIAALTLLPASFEAAPLQARTTRAEPAKPVAEVDDLLRVPDDAAGFATINVAELWDKEIVKTLLKQMAELKPEEGLTKALGVAPGEIQRITVIVPANPEHFCMVVRTRKPIKSEAVQKLLFPKATTILYEKLFYYVEGGSALHFLPDGRGYLIGTLPGVHEQRTQTPSGTEKGALAAARTLARKNLIVVAGNLYNPVIRKGLESAPKEVQQPYGRLLAARTATLMIDLAAVNRIQVILQMNNEPDARAGLAEMKQLIGLGTDSLARLKKEIPADAPAQARQGFTILESLLQKVQATTTGTTLDVTLRDEKAEMVVGVVAVTTGILVPAIQSIRLAAARTQRSNDLKIIGIAYNNYLFANAGKGPLNLDVLVPYLEGDNKRLLEDMKSGAIVINYGIAVARFNVEGSSNIVLSYEKDVPTKGGQVGMADGSVRMMTAEEYMKATTPKK